MNAKEKKEWDNIYLPAVRLHLKEIIPPPAAGDNEDDEISRYLSAAIARQGLPTAHDWPDTAQSLAERLYEHLDVLLGYEKASDHPVTEPETEGEKKVNPTFEDPAHKRNAALKQAEESFGLSRDRDALGIGQLLSKIFGAPWNKTVEQHSVDDIKNAIIAARAAQGDQPAFTPPPQSKPRPAAGNGRQPGETYQDYIRRRYTVDLKGKDYLQTAGRIMLWWADNPLDSGWQIVTEPVTFDADSVVFRAAIINPNGVTVATGYAWATNAGDKSKNFGGRIWEKAETAAIGRALAHIGYGTEEPDDDYLADAPVEQE